MGERAGGRRGCGAARGTHVVDVVAIRRDANVVQGVLELRGGLDGSTRGHHSSDNVRDEVEPDGGVARLARVVSSNHDDV